MTAEPREIRLKRLTMRSSRRGTKEMDILLMRFAGARLPQMEGEALDLYEALLEESDQDLYQWISGQAPAPDAYATLVRDIAETAEAGAAK